MQEPTKAKKNKKKKGKEKKDAQKDDLGALQLEAAVAALKEKLEKEGIQVDYSIHEDHRLGCFIKSSDFDIDKAFAQFTYCLVSVSSTPSRSRPPLLPPLSPRKCERR